MPGLAIGLGPAFDMLTVVIHVCGLALIGGKVVDVLDQAVGRRLHAKIRRGHRRYGLAGLPSFTVLREPLGRGFRFLGALPDNSSAMLYSLSAMTTYGHEALYLELHWQLWEL